MATEQLDGRLRVVALQCGFACFALLVCACASSALGDRDGGADASAESDAASDACQPSCDGRECGDDGCGGNCEPGCTGGDSCTEAGLCEPPCESTWSASITGMAAAQIALAPGGELYVAAVVDDALRVLRYGDDDCATTGPCACDPAWTSPAIALGTAHTEPRDILLLDGSAYVAGFAADTETPDDRFGFVARVDLGTGDVLGVYTWDPTTYFDGFAAIATDGDEVYAVGMLGWEGDAPFATATATIHAIPHPVTGTTTAASWTHNPEQATILLGVAVDPTDEAIFASGRAGAEGVVLRCTTSGACP